ncbi:MAG: aminotransferase class III-fold pyridoxal phosphate-dependent enzyme, partial [Rhodospirillaceae bacterium]|nr:aminotransferase class III-fold pyridoxal phosphate-dependent enzyme [Rhodospirillaceae bacterium]
KPILAWVVDAARAVPGIDKVCVATSTGESDNSIAAWCSDNDVICHRGSEDDVLARFVLAAKTENADVVMRLTADCPFLDPQVCGQVLALFGRAAADYVSNVDPPSWPDGLDCEVVSMDALATADKEATTAHQREHVTPFIRNDRARFNVGNVLCSLPGLAGERWTVDTSNDLDFARAVADKLKNDTPPSFLDVLAVLDADPSLRGKNADASRNEGSRPSITGPLEQIQEFGNSADMLVRAEKTIPLGTQTFSKSRLIFASGHAPLFLTHGDGGRVWDVDANVYVDLVCGLLPVVLGYRDPDVDAAIRDQLGRGISFSLATSLESDLAERLVDIFPCAEKVRFGKNGSDATTGAVRLARAFTGRDQIAVCGYHGWQDWYIGSTTRNKGVPDAVRELTHRVPYNDLAAVDEMMNAHRGEFAALILEPMNLIEPEPGYLADLKQLVNGHGALLIFDEVITGFRYALGGAQELFGVTPDLAALGKGMGNGMPIAAVAGRTDVMAEMEEVFYSGTFGGETLSLAAAIAVIDKMRREPVIERLWQTGKAIADGAEAAINDNNLTDVFALPGKDPWRVLDVRDHAEASKEAIKTLYMSEMLKRGVLTAGGHNVCYAHNDIDIARVVAAYGEVMPVITAELATGKLEGNLKQPVVEPVFRVRE